MYRPMKTVAVFVCVLCASWGFAVAVHAQGAPPSSSPQTPAVQAPSPTTSKPSPPTRPPQSGDAADRLSDVEGGVSHALNLRLGFNRASLRAPADPPGGPTLLSGTSFAGVGLGVGASYEVNGLWSWLSLESGLFYARNTMTGFEASGDQLREALLQLDTLRVPLWMKVKVAPVSALRLVFGVGPEVVFGLASGSSVRERNIPLDEAQVIRTESPNTVHLTGLLGVELDGGAVSFPLMVHLSYNPLVGDSTAERFAGNSGDALGTLRLQVEFELLVTLGVSYDL